MSFLLVIAAAAAPAVAAEVQIITEAGKLVMRSLDGAKPFYTFVRDTEGTATGDGMGGVWHLLPTAPAK
jgi:predicted lipoprotein with Yx(FWY)xxD motif